MSNSNSYARRSGKVFDPSVLDRSVIAIPLLREIEGEVEQIEAAQRTWPDIADRFTGAIFYNPAFPGGLPAARKKVAELLKVAKTKTQSRNAAETIDEPLPEVEGRVSFSNVNSRTTRKLLALNSDLPERPILRIVPSRFEIIIDVNLDNPAGREAARTWIIENLEESKTRVDVVDPEQRVHLAKTKTSNQYVFARLEGRAIKELVRMDAANAELLVAGAKKAAAAANKATQQAKKKSRGKHAVEADATQNPSRYRAIHRIWPDFPITSCITKSLSTVKADAAQNSFAAVGTDITWAVMDSGIDWKHPHFARHGNIDPRSNLHADFTDTPDVPEQINPALVDRFGHGTHVAGIIAGEQVADGSRAGRKKMLAVTRSVRGYEEGELPKIDVQEIPLDAIRGMAPKCRLVSLKVLDDDGHGEVSNLIAALAHVQERNGHGRRFLIHGLNISLGYDFDPEWFACGQSPLCVEINRLEIGRAHV